MFHNYFFLKRLAEALKAKILQKELVACFSQNKDELILGFADKVSEFWIRANLDAVISLLAFPDSFSRARKNSVDLFPEVVGSKVKNCRVFNYERSFQVEFENGFQLVFKMHGRRSNILLGSDNKAIKLFRKKLTADASLDISSLDKTIAINEPTFADSNYHPNTLIPALGKEVESYWNENYATLDDEKKWEAFQKLLQLIETSPIYLIKEEKPRISLLPATDSETTQDPIHATNWLYHESIHEHFVEGKKKQLIANLEQQINKAEKYQFKTSEKLRLLQEQRNPEEIANIIMANLGLIERGLSKVVLSDIYQSGLIEIKLNPKLSPQKNAENYYRKSKNRHQEVSSLEANIQKKESEIQKLKQELAQLREIEEHADLKQVLKKHQKGAVSKTASVKPYHEFQFEDWVILVGKNAKSNDELTLKVATKNDLWLHARDVSGSHVVIKHRPGHIYSSNVIEYAAGLAAYNSKRKSDSLCPVIYTPKKFVRKVKGSPPGQVVVEKEEVIMVEPKPAD